MNLLGLDYGSSHIGVALATGPLAEPLVTLDTKTALSSIKELLNKFSIDAIVVGDTDPEFLKSLSSFNLPVHQADETLSTRDAKQALLHTTQTRRREQEHEVAAALILQSWLDSGVQNS